MMMGNPYVVRYGDVEIKRLTLHLRVDSSNHDRIRKCADSIARIGLKTPPVGVTWRGLCRVDTGVLRVNACKKLGWTTIPMIIADNCEMFPELEVIPWPEARERILALYHAPPAYMDIGPHTFQLGAPKEWPKEPDIS